MLSTRASTFPKFETKSLKNPFQSVSEYCSVLEGTGFSIAAILSLESVFIPIDEGWTINYDDMAIKKY